MSLHGDQIPALDASLCGHSQSLPLERHTSEEGKRKELELR